MENFTIEELGYLISLCGAVGVSCVAVIIRSRCKTIDTPCIKCKREVIHDPNEKIEKTTSNESENNTDQENNNQPMAEP